MTNSEVAAEDSLGNCPVGVISTGRPGPIKEYLPHIDKLGIVAGGSEAEAFGKEYHSLGREG